MALVAPAVPSSVVTSASLASALLRQSQTFQQPKTMATRRAKPSASPTMAFTCPTGLSWAQGVMAAGSRACYRV